MNGTDSQLLTRPTFGFTSEHVPDDSRQPFINKRKLCLIALSSRDRGSAKGMTGDWHPHDSMNKGTWEWQ